MLVEFLPTYCTGQVESGEAVALVTEQRLIVETRGGVADLRQLGKRVAGLAEPSLRQPARGTARTADCLGVCISLSAGTAGARFRASHGDGDRDGSEKMTT